MILTTTAGVAAVSTQVTDKEAVCGSQACSGQDTHTGVL